MNTETKTLLIIGNGFDLQCGLNSSYKHFFKWLNDNKESCQRCDITFNNEKLYDENSFCDNEICSNSNEWSKHFLEKSLGGENWVDVETEIKETLLETYKHDKSFDFYETFQELRRFEKQFSEYLKTQIDENYEKKPSNF